MAKSYYERKRADETAGMQSVSDQQSKEDRLVAISRERAQPYLRLPKVTSVGVGHRIRDGKRTGELTIQFTVSKKLPMAELETAGITPLPKEIDAGDGTKVPVDVLERNYQPSYRLIEEPTDRRQMETLEPEEERSARRTRLETMVPGVSISNYRLSAGTLGAIVYDRATGEPFVLSNWHVLHGPGGAVGDAIVQPGPYDEPGYTGNVVGRLVRAHLGYAGDCAIASIEGRSFSEEILGLAVTPRRAAKVNLDDRVVKSGRTTGITRGVVTRIGVAANIDYGGSVGVQQVGGFEIRPDDNAPPVDGEISQPGDSGSVWMIDGAGGDGSANDVVVGLHFAGESDPEPAAEHALACNIHSVLEKLNVTIADPAADPSSHRDRLDAIAQQVQLLAQRMATMNAQKAGGCSCHGSTEREDMPAMPEGFPIYGNWCGPGHGGGVPIDDIDRACMQHDQCFDARGWGDCSCNRELQAAIDAALRSGRVNPRGRFIGPIMRRWFDLQPCRDGGFGGREAMAMSGGMGSAMNGPMSGAATAGLRPSLDRHTPSRGRSAYGQAQRR